MDSLVDIIDFFLSETSGDKTHTNKSYSKAVNSFVRSVNSDATVPEQIMTSWLNSLLIQGYSYKVISYYLKIVSSLYNKGVKAGKFSPTDIFASVKEKLRQIESWDFDLRQREDDFLRLQTLAKSASRHSGAQATTTDLLLTCILSDIKSPETAAMLKRDNADVFQHGLSEIFDRNISAKRKYIFDLRQSHLTKRQIVQQLEKSISGLLTLKGFSRRLPVKDTIANLWAFAALKSGIEISKIVGCLGQRPANNPIFAFCDAENVSDDEKSKILSSVAKVILINPQEWFVMRLRPGVKYKTVEQQIAQHDLGTAQPQLFYPCDEIRRRIKNRTVFEQKPIIPDIVFFKTRMTDVLPLFRIIGDKAWCYTTDGQSGKYAVVPQKAMQAFQQAIGKFTSDYEVGPIGSVVPKKGDKIVIIGGLFSGKEGTVERVEECDEASNTIYRIKFPDEQGFEWRVGVDSRLVKHTAE